MWDSPLFSQAVTVRDLASQFRFIRIPASFLPLQVLLLQLQLPGMLSSFSSRDAPLMASTSPQVKQPARSIFLNLTDWRTIHPERNSAWFPPAHPQLLSENCFFHTKVFPSPPTLSVHKWDEDVSRPIDRKRESEEEFQYAYLSPKLTSKKGPPSYSSLN